MHLFYVIMMPYSNLNNLQTQFKSKIYNFKYILKIN